MARVPTVMVTTYKVINISDFDPEKHEIYLGPDEATIEAIADLVIDEKLRPDAIQERFGFEKDNPVYRRVIAAVTARHMTTDPK